MDITLDFFGMKCYNILLWVVIVKGGDKVKSMTGYGQAKACSEKYEVSVEVHSVNHRFLETSVRMPRNYNSLEEKIKSVAQKVIFRGKTDIGVTIQLISEKSVAVEVNHEVVTAYIEAVALENKKLKEDKEQLSINRCTDDYSVMVGDTWGANTVLSLSTMLRIPEAFQVKQEVQDEVAVWQILEPVLQEALKRFLEMRETEGARLRDDVAMHLDRLESMTDRVEQLVPETVKLYYDKLYRKIAELLSDRTIDESRLVTEAAVVAEKIAVDEELVRLRSHIAQMRGFLECEEPVGRKMDFLVQEMNREVNTTGSKSQSLEITRLVVDMKSEIEKIREQIQNIE